MLAKLRAKYLKATYGTEKDVLFSFYAVWAFSFLIMCPFPADDLLRDVIVGNYGFDYRNLYIYSPLMVQYNQYILFDWILHQISIITGNMWTVRIVQLFIVLNFVIPLQLIFLRIFHNRSDRYLVTLIAIALTVNTMVLHRLYLGRPEALMAGWMLWGFVSNKALTKLAWIIYGVVLIPFYWLAIIYSPITLIVFEKKLNKFIAFLILSIINVIFWQWYSGFQWIHTFSLLNQELANRIGTQVVTENHSIIFAILSPTFSLMLVVYVFMLLPIIKSFMRTRKWCFNKKYLWITIVLIWFISANMIRYVDIIVPLVVILFAKYMAEYPLILKSKAVQVFVVMVCSFSIFYANQSTVKPSKFSEIPRGSRVLATFNGINYFVPFFNKEKIQIAPSMEIGATDRNLQVIISDIQMKGTLDCNALKKFQFDYLVERSLIEIPRCLILVGVNREFRLWKIKSN